ncbi:MAG: dockerin type I repeat-containing protein [Oscillospiraceae bacterium]|nr:dockerin type I repeat-containing protein [Oscillospiraceae bacterium]
MKKKTLTAVLLSSVLLSSVCAVPFAGAAEQNNTDVNEEQNSGISTENGEENNYYTAAPADEVTDAETVECYVLYRVSDVYTAHFLNEYQASLEKNGISAEEAKTMTGELRKQINENGAITDPEIEKQRQEYCTQKIDEEMDKACQTIGVDRKDVTIVRNEMSHCIKGEMTSKQITAAETLTRNYAIVTVGDEVGKYKGKIANKLLLDKIREDEENIEVSVRIKSASGELGTVTDKERTSYVKDIFDAAGIDSFGSINQTMFKYLQIDDEFIYLLETETTLNAEQLEKLCEADEVLEVTALPPWRQAEPTDPVVAPPLESVTGDLNGDGIIDVSDLTMLSLALLGDNELSDSQKKNADVDSDSEITVADLARLRQYLSKKIVSFDDKTPSEPVKDPSADGYEFSVNYCTASNQIIGPQTEVFTSEKELNEYLEQNQDKMIRLNDEANYDAEWFENHNLVMVLLKEPYLDFGHEVTYVDSQKIKITRLKQRNVSPMEKGWAIFIELDKDSEMSSEKINVVITDKEVDSVSAYLQGKR